MVAGPLTIENVTGRPLLAVALRVNGVSLKVFPLKAPKVMDWGALLIIKVRSTLVAAAKLVLPAWEARTVTVPAPVKVMAFAAIIAGPLTIENVTGKPLLATALRLMGVFVNDVFVNVQKVIL